LQEDTRPKPKGNNQRKGLRFIIWSSPRCSIVSSIWQIVGRAPSHLTSICAKFYPCDDPRSTFHGPMSDGLILRALPPSWCDRGAVNTKQAPRREKRIVGRLCANFMAKESPLPEVQRPEGPSLFRRRAYCE
jgi:hypothetical protein